jgi:hypothetical protein
MMLQRSVAYVFFSEAVKLTRVRVSFSLEFLTLCCTSSHNVLLPSSVVNFVSVIINLVNSEKTTQDWLSRKVTESSLLWTTVQSPLPKTLPSKGFPSCPFFSPFICFFFTLLVYIIVLFFLLLLSIVYWLCFFWQQDSLTRSFHPTFW